MEDSNREKITANNFSDEVTKAFDSVLNYVIMNLAYHRLNLLSVHDDRKITFKSLDAFEWIHMILDHEKSEYINEMLEELRAGIESDII